MEKLQPMLRFPEYKGDWERKKLSQVSSINRGKSKHRPRDAEHLYGGKYPFIQTGDIRNADLFLSKYTQTYSDAGLKQSKLWDVNTLCITIAANIAETTILKIKACFPDSVIGLIPNENDTIVLFVKYQFDKFKLEIQSLSQGVAQANLNQEKLSNIEFNFPNLPEQTKIANFLASVDEKLNLLKEKKEALEKYKKGMMQKIFSQEIRFKDNNGKDFEEWEEKTLGEVSSCYSGGTPLTTKKEYYTGTIPFIKSGEISNYETNQFISESGLKNSSAKMVSKGDILYAMYGATSGEVSISKINGAINQAVLCIKSNLNHIYLFNFLKFEKENIINTFIQGGQGNLSANIIKELKIPNPCVNEQIKIANFLSAIDEKIELVLKQIEDTKEYKKGLLQGMFC